MARAAIVHVRPQRRHQIADLACTWDRSHFGPVAAAMNDDRQRDGVVEFTPSSPETVPSNKDLQLTSSYQAIGELDVAGARIIKFPAAIAPAAGFFCCWTNVLLVGMSLGHPLSRQSL